MLEHPRFSAINPLRTRVRAIDHDIEPLLNLLSDFLEPHDMSVAELADASGLVPGTVLRGLHRLRGFHEVEEYTRAGDGSETDRRAWRLNVRGVWVQSYRTNQCLSLFPPSGRRPVLEPAGKPKALPADW